MGGLLGFVGGFLERFVGRFRNFQKILKLLGSVWRCFEDLGLYAGFERFLRGLWFYFWEVNFFVRIVFTCRNALKRGGCVNVCV